MQPNLINMIGRTIGRLTVLQKVCAPKGYSSAFWLCRCACGKTSIVKGYTLRAGLTLSCGCLRNEAARAKRTHGQSHSREYRAWAAAKTRCYNTKIAEYPRYGGRGITMSPLWRHNFRQFLADMGPCPQGYTLERVDNNRGYDAANCQWATRSQQSQNRDANRMLTLNDIMLSTAEWERKLGFKSGTIKRRLQRGWSALKALTTPTK